jgi:hypothetical protein
MVVHGGLFSRDDVTLDEIRKIDRFRCVCVCVLVFVQRL